MFAHCALVLGFLVLTASRFIPLVYFGALLSLSMAGGLFGDLVLLPLLLRWTSPADVNVDNASMGDTLQNKTLTAEEDEEELPSGSQSPADSPG